MSPNEVRATRIGRKLSDKLVACIQCSIISANKMGAIGTGVQLPGHLIADTMCSDMPLSNQTLVARISGRPLQMVQRWTNHHVLMLDSHCFLWWLYITQPILCNEVFPECVWNKDCTFQLRLLGDVKRYLLPLKEPLLERSIWIVDVHELHP
jgi:hypothetical protein